MGAFPEGARIIPNPVNRIPGFSFGEHHFVPGFRQMAWPMLEWVLDERYRELFDRDRWSEESILVFDAGESQLIAAMESVGALYARVKVFSLPTMAADGGRRPVELGVRGDPKRGAEAAAALREAVRKAGFPFSGAEKTKPA